MDDRDYACKNANLSLRKAGTNYRLRIRQQYQKTDKTTLTILKLSVIHSLLVV
jgi:hypothetical protein